jgi:hypothetical protein
MGAVIIKMMSSTKTTSTKGVMLMSAMELAVRGWRMGAAMIGPPNYE